MKLTVKKLSKTLLSSLIASTFLVACGQSSDLPAAPALQGAGMNNGTLAQLQQLQSTVNELKNKLDSMDSFSGGGAPVADFAPEGPSVPRVRSSKSRRVSAKPGVKALPSSKRALSKRSSKASAKKKGPSGRELLDQVLNTIKTNAGFDANVTKFEANIDTGEAGTEALIRVVGKNPHQIMIEVLKHPKKKGLKVGYTGGASQIKARPGGALSFISVNKPMNDDEVTSTNGFKPDDLDFYSVVKRLSSPAYTATLAGKTTLNGQPVHILKVSAKSGNTLHPKIAHEYIGFDPASKTLRIWEAFAPGYQGAKQPFLRLRVQSYQTLTSVPASMLKV